MKHQDLATYKRKHSIEGLLTVAEIEPMTIMAGGMVAGRQTQHWSNSLELTLILQVLGREREWYWA